MESHTERDYIKIVKSQKQKESWKQKEKSQLSHTRTPTKSDSIFPFRNHRGQKTMGDVFKLLSEKKKKLSTKNLISDKTIPKSEGEINTFPVKQTQDFVAL